MTDLTKISVDELRTILFPIADAVWDKDAILAFDELARRLREQEQRVKELENIIHLSAANGKSRFIY